MGKHRAPRAQQAQHKRNTPVASHVITLHDPVTDYARCYCGWEGSWQRRGDHAQGSGLGRVVVE